jgi:hypothetical protein
MMFLLNFVLIAVSVFSFSVAGLVELSIGGFADELDILNQGFKYGQSQSEREQIRT